MQRRLNLEKPKTKVNFGRVAIKCGFLTIITLGGYTALTEKGMHDHALKPERITPSTLDEPSKQEHKSLKKPKSNDFDNFRLLDVECENKRLLLQRDIQRLIGSAKKKPFNHKSGDNCTLTLSSNDKKIVFKECTNEVFKRFIQTLLPESETTKILSKYSFEKNTPHFEVKLK